VDHVGEMDVHHLSFYDVKNCFQAKKIFKLKYKKKQKGSLPCLSRVVF